MKLSFIEQLKNVVKGLKDVPLEDGQMLVASVPREELANTPLGLKKDVPPVPTPPPVAPVSDVPVTHTPLSDGPFASSPNADTVSDQSREMNLDMIDEEEEESLYGDTKQKKRSPKKMKTNTREVKDDSKGIKKEKSTSIPVAPGSPEGVSPEERAIPQPPKTQEQSQNAFERFILTEKGKNVIAMFRQILTREWKYFEKAVDIEAKKNNISPTPKEKADLWNTVFLGRLKETFDRYLEKNTDRDIPEERREILEVLIRTLENEDKIQQAQNK